MATLLLPLCLWILGLMRFCCASAPSPTPTVSVSRYQETGGGLDIAYIFDPITNLLFHASLNDTLPTLPLLQLIYTSSYVPTTIDVCSKANIGKCIARGNISNGLPRRLRGIWWSDGLGTVSQGFTTVGTWDLPTRKLKVPYYAIIEDATSSKFVNGAWTNSGAGDINFLLTFLTSLNIYMTEDYSSGQIVVGFTLFGITIEYPTFIFDFTLQWIGFDMWVRKTKIFGIGSNVGDYALKRIVNGDGLNGRWFSDWLEYRNGSDVAVPSIFRPE